MIETKISLSVIRLNDSPISNTTPATGAGKKIMKLEAIRGFAAFYVVCHHTLPKIIVIAGREFALFRYAQEAVILFFILSGFVIQYSYTTSSDKSFRSFFLKRFLRIYIPLLCVFAANYLIIAISAHQPTGINWTSLAGNLLMLQQVPEIWRHSVLFQPFLGNLPLWSLTFEWWFYLIFFYLFTQFGNRATQIVYITGVISALTYLFYPFFINRELMYLVIWWAGADVAKLYINKRNINIKNLLYPLLSLSLITVILLFNIGLYKKTHPGEELMFAISPMVEVRHFGFAVLALLIAICWKKINWTGFKYTLGLFEPLAPISFALYISHWFLISNAKYLDPFISNIYLKSFLYFIVCCLFCYVVESIIYPYTSKRILSYFPVKKKPFVAVR